MLAPFISRLRSRPWLWLLIFIGAISGALPDLIGAYGFFVEDDSELYQSAHSGPISNVLQYIPMSALHLYVDSFTHEQTQHWKKWNERMWVEVLMWVVNIWLIYWFTRIWKRNAARAAP